MNIKRLYLVIELILIVIYSFMTLFSIVLQPINIILGFFIVFILPGYNLLNLIKPKFRFIEKLGYSIIISLAVENISMFFSYIILYNYGTYPDATSRGFIFNSTLLIASIIFINFILIIINEFKNFKIKIKSNKNQKRDYSINLDRIKYNLDLKKSLVIVTFALSLILLCISTLNSEVPNNNDYLTNRYDYRSNFTFFYRVPLIFYAFLIISILCFTYIVFFIKNDYIILIAISMFIYCLWILPYLQIGNYFGHDTHLLSMDYEIYLDHGIMTYSGFNFVIFNFDSLRYSTGLFTTILLISATNVSLDFALWYLYPMLYIFIPCLFYSVFKKFLNKSKNGDYTLIIMVIFVIFTPQFIKFGHATGTGVLGTLIYFILVIEFYNLMQKNEFNIYNSFLIILLYFFLTLTHTEECIYFLVLMILYYIYYLFLKLKKIEKNSIFSPDFLKSPSKVESFYLHQIVLQELAQKKIKNIHKKFSALLCILILIFYIANEFIGWFRIYFLMLFGNFPFLAIFYDIFIQTKIIIPFFLRGEISFSIFILASIFFGVFLLNYIIYLIFFKKFNFILKIYNTGINFARKIYYYITKLISKKIFQVFFFIMFFSLIIFIDFFVLVPLEETILLTIIALILSYSVMVIYIFFFFKGFKYFRLNNNRQNFFLISLFSSLTMVFMLVITGSLWLAIYVIHGKYLSHFVFFSLIIIQNTYIQKLREKKNNFLICMVILVIILGIFYGLRTLAFG